MDDQAFIDLAWPRAMGEAARQLAAGEDMTALAVLVLGDTGAASALCRRIYGTPGPTCAVLPRRTVAMLARALGVRGPLSAMLERPGAAGVMPFLVVRGDQATLHLREYDVRRRGGVEA